METENKFKFSWYLLIPAFFLFIGFSMLYSLFSDHKEDNAKREREQLTISTISNQFSIYNNLFSDFRNENRFTTLTEKIDFSNKGFYVLKKENHLINNPYLSVNNILKEKNHLVTTTTSQLDFFFICENKFHPKGKYTNGYNAFQVESIIYLIDINGRKFYELYREMGTLPPVTISGSHDANGSMLRHKEFANKISDYL